MGIDSPDLSGLRPSNEGRSILPEGLVDTMALFDEMRSLSRRTVLRLAAVGSMGSLLAACTPAATPAPTAAPAPPAPPTSAPAAPPTAAPAPPTAAAAAATAAPKPTAAPAAAATTAPAP